MTTVLLALVPATAVNLYLFGWPAILLFAITLAACVAAEAASLALAGRPVRVTLLDGSAVVTGWLLAMSLPPWAPWWTGVLGAVFAIRWPSTRSGRRLGQNLFNPAMVARVALLVSFPVVMTAWVIPQPLLSAAAPDLGEAVAITFGGQVVPDAVTSASALGHVKTELTAGSRFPSRRPSSRPDGHGAGPARRQPGGDLGAADPGRRLFLIARRIISWHIPVGLMGALFVTAALFNAIDPIASPGGCFTSSPAPPSWGPSSSRPTTSRRPSRSKASWFSASVVGC